MPAKNMLVQLLALYTDRESHNAQHYRQTDRRQDYANSRSYCVAVRSAKNPPVTLFRLCSLIAIRSMLGLCKQLLVTYLLVTCMYIASAALQNARRSNGCPVCSWTLLTEVDETTLLGSLFHMTITIWLKKFWHTCRVDRGLEWTESRARGRETARTIRL